MSAPDTLGDRMKGYESVPRIRLVPKLPVMMRLDGRAFHTLTRGMARPWDAHFSECMWETAKMLCAEVSGTRLAYVQSDEITLLLADYDTPRTQGWFDYDLQKLCSVAAGMASATLALLLERPLSFDCRAWNLPPHEVTNAFIWRQQDAMRNSVSMLAQAHYGPKQLHGKSTVDMRQMLSRDHGISWADQPSEYTRGVCVLKRAYHVAAFTDGECVRTEWYLDTPPVFTEQREYIERHVAPRERVE